MSIESREGTLESDSAVSFLAFPFLVVVLSVLHHHPSELSGKPVKMQMTASQSQFLSLELGPNMCIFSKFPGDASAASLVIPLAERQ